MPRLNHTLVSFMSFVVERTQTALTTEATEATEDCKKWNGFGHAGAPGEPPMCGFPPCPLRPLWFNQGLLNREGH